MANKFTERLTRPLSGNKFYNTKASGGINTSIKGSPTDKQCDVLANCVGYAQGRFNEIYYTITGEMKNIAPTLNSNAENFVERAIALGFKTGSKPVVGAIACWQKGETLTGKDGAGHVAVVERVIGNNKIITSESGYNASQPFWTKTRTNANGNWGQGKTYKFRCFIYNPAVVVEETPTTITEKKAKGVATSGPNNYFSGKYTVIASALNIRDSAGTNSASLGLLPKDTIVRCYGYYSIVNGTKWLYVQALVGNIQYTGFCSSSYLKKI